MQIPQIKSHHKINLENGDITIFKPKFDSVMTHVTYTTQSEVDGTEL